ncbi:MAG: glycosyltransferase family 4 protein [bacterium]
MKILMMTTAYPPENLPWGVKFAELAAAWKQRGHDVTVLTGYPHWPEGKLHTGYRRRWVYVEEIDSIRVVRAWHFIPSRNSFFHRTLAFLTLGLSMRLAGRRHGPFDLVYAAIPPPTVATAAISIAGRFHCPSVLDIEDMHPDASIDSGFITNPLLIALLRRQERWIYRHATLLCPLGNHFFERLKEKGVPEKRLHRIWNWIDTDEVRPLPRVNGLRREWNIPEETFVVLYAGTMGRQHGTRVLIDAANRMREDRNILFLMVGMGVEREQNEQLAGELKLHNVQFHDFVPRSRLAELQALADVSVVTLLPGRGHSSNPSKLLGYLAAERPVIAAVQDDCDTASIMYEAECGIIVAPSDDENLANLIDSVRNSPEKMKNWGKNGRKWVKKNASLSGLGEMAEGILAAAIDLHE